MSNADKFVEAANGVFPSDALPDQQVYEHPLVKRYATKEMSFVLKSMFIELNNSFNAELY